MTDTERTAPVSSTATLAELARIVVTMNGKPEHTGVAAADVRIRIAQLRAAITELEWLTEEIERSPRVRRVTSEDVIARITQISAEQAIVAE